MAEKRLSRVHSYATSPMCPWVCVSLDDLGRVPMASFTSQQDLNMSFDVTNETKVKTKFCMGRCVASE